MANGPLDERQVKSYHEDGRVLVRGMFQREAIGMLHRAAKADKETPLIACLPFSTNPGPLNDTDWP